MLCACPSGGNEDHFILRLWERNLPTATQVLTKLTPVFKQCYNTQNIQTPKAQLLPNLFNRSKNKTCSPLTLLGVPGPLAQRGKYLPVFEKPWPTPCSKVPSALDTKTELGSLCGWHTFAAQRKHPLHEEFHNYHVCVCSGVRMIYKVKTIVSLCTCCQISMHH